MSEVIYEKKDNLAFITLNRPAQLNAINRTMTRELAKVWADFQNDDRLWIAVLSGQGESFCAGADIGEMNPDNWSYRQSLIFGDDSCMPSRYAVWKPIIVALRGKVLGAGLWLALDCDIRVATASAVFGVPEVRYNIPVLFAAYISQHISRNSAADLMLTGDRINAQRAYEIELINRVVPDDQLMSSAISLAEAMCVNGPLSMRATKEIFRRSAGMDFQSALRLTEQLSLPVLQSADFLEAKRAFREKRKPKWQGK